MLTCPLFGMLTDRFESRKKFLIVSNIIGLVAVYPAFWFIQNNPTLAVVIPAVVVIVAVLSASSSAGFLLFMEAFPRRERATGISIIYATGVTLFGGFAQFIVAALLSMTNNNPMTPAWYMLICSMISYMALLAFDEKRRYID